MLWTELNEVYYAQVSGTAMEEMCTGGYGDWVIMSTCSAIKRTLQSIGHGKEASEGQCCCDYGIGRKFQLCHNPPRLFPIEVNSACVCRHYIMYKWSFAVQNLLLLLLGPAFLCSGL